MDFFDALAVTGAVTGSVGAATQVYVARRDRAVMTVSFGYKDAAGEMIAPYIDVANIGRQPVPLLEVGLYGGMFPFTVLESDSHPELHGDGGWSLRALDDPTVLREGQHLRLPLSLRGMLGAVVDEPFHIDHPFRVYADTPRGRTWGKAGPYVRMVYRETTRPAEIRTAQWDPCNPPLRAPRVEPRWHLWKRRELRTGRPRRPSFDELRQLTGTGD